MFSVQRKSTVSYEFCKISLNWTRTKTIGNREKFRAIHKCEEKPLLNTFLKRENIFALRVKDERGMELYKM